MDKIKCLIVDDEELARDLQENYINRLPHLHIVSKCANPLEALEILQKEPVDLIFLDIQMPELSGVEFLKTLKRSPLVIFTTAYKEYALQGYELDVVDYLLKPFRFERFVQAVNKATNLLKAQNDNLAKAPHTTEDDTSDKRDYILVKSDFKVFRILYKEILYVESMKEYVAYHTKGGRTLSLGSLKKLQAELPKDQFIRIHKSYIANIHFISALEGNMVHLDGKKLPIGPSYREEVISRVF